MPVDARYLYQLFEPGLVLGIGNPTCGQPVSRLTIPGIGGEPVGGGEFVISPTP